MDCVDREAADSFERQAARFIAAAVCHVSEQWMSLVFASPLGTRSTDLNLLWHTGYRRKHTPALILSLLQMLGVSVLKGLCRCLPSFRRFGHAVYGNPTDHILVVPLSCGRKSGNRTFETPYVSTRTGDSLYVFGAVSSLGQHAEQDDLRFCRDVASPCVALLRAGWLALAEVKATFPERLLLGLQWAEWTLSLDWLIYLGLEQSLSRLVRARGIKRIGCIHEMHAHSKVVWRVAAMCGARGYTVQHASISLGKRWYFPYPEELCAGLELPDTFFVFEPHVAQLLKPFYNETQFVEGCSCRYAQWSARDAEVTKAGGGILFVTALPFYDNDVVIGSARKFLQDANGSMPVHFRLHPAAQLSRRARNWLTQNVSNGVVTLSNGSSLRVDLEGAKVVVGMGSTSLQEALVAGRPIIQLLHQDFLHYVDVEGMAGVIRVDYREFSCRTIEDAITRRVDIREARRRLGLDHPPVTYERLFAADTATSQGRQDTMMASAHALLHEPASRAT
jgi:hypothetical protein